MMISYILSLGYECLMLTERDIEFKIVQMNRAY